MITSFNLHTFRKASKTFEEMHLFDCSSSVISPKRAGRRVNYNSLQSCSKCPTSFSSLGHANSPPTQDNLAAAPANCRSSKHCKQSVWKLEEVSNFFLAPPNHLTADKELCEAGLVRTLPQSRKEDFLFFSCRSSKHCSTTTSTLSAHSGQSSKIITTLA